MTDNEWVSGGAYVAYEWLTEQRQRVLGQMSLRELAELRLALDDLIHERVLEWRAQGATWQVIGDELLITKQAAHARHRVWEPRSKRLDRPSK